VSQQGSAPLTAATIARIRTALEAAQLLGEDAALCILPTVALQPAAKAVGSVATSDAAAHGSRRSYGSAMMPLLAAAEGAAVVHAQLQDQGTPTYLMPIPEPSCAAGGDRATMQVVEALLQATKEAATRARSHSW